MADKEDTFHVTICMLDAAEARVAADVLKTAVPGIQVRVVKKESDFPACLSSVKIDFLLMDLGPFVAARERVAQVGPIAILVCGPGEQSAAREQLARGAFDIFVWDRSAGEGFEDRFSAYFRALTALRGRFRGVYSALERRYENLVRALPDIIYELDTDGDSASSTTP
jgi:PAS domain-containing protein